MSNQALSLQKVRQAVAQAQQALEQAQSALTAAEKLLMQPADDSLTTADNPLIAVMDYLNFLQENDGLSKEAHAHVSEAVMAYLTFLQNEEEGGARAQRTVRHCVCLLHICCH